MSGAGEILLEQALFCLITKRSLWRSHHSSFAEGGSRLDLKGCDRGPKWLAKRGRWAPKLLDGAIGARLDMMNHESSQRQRMVRSRRGSAANQCVGDQDLWSVPALASHTFSGPWASDFSGRRSVESKLGVAGSVDTGMQSGILGGSFPGVTTTGCMHNREGVTTSRRV